jgi:hypothetical protein
MAAWSHVVTYLYLGNVSSNKSFSFSTVLNL